MPWRASKPNATKLQHECDRLSVQLRQAREQLQIQERHRVGLEVMLDTRAERIDQLTAKLDQSRQQVRRLDEENERLAEMVRFTPPVDATTLAAK